MPPLAAEEEATADGAAGGATGAIGGAAAATLDPFSARVRLNGQLLPDLVDLAPNYGAGGRNADEPVFLQQIPVAAATGQCNGGSCATELPPLSVSFVCYA